MLGRLLSASVVLMLAAGVVAPATVAEAAGYTTRPAALIGANAAEYVALGDSYAAGYGLAEHTGKPVDACGQSRLNYPHRIAAQLGLDLTDVTCAGATTADIRTKHQYAGVPPQLDALSRHTRLVTLSIGGNDANLFETAASCLAISAKGPVFSGHDASSCRSQLVHRGRDTLAKRIRHTMRPALARTLAAVKAAAPNAEIVMVGYPAIFPDRAHTPKRGCFRAAFDLGALSGTFPADSFPFTKTDTRYLASVQRRLNSASRSVARAEGVDFVDVLHATSKHSACATRDRYVAGVTLSSTSNLRSIELEHRSLHPTRRGQQYLAKRAERVIERVLR